MSIFDGKRIQPEVFQIDAERMQSGWYTDKYFQNIVKIMEALDKENYRYKGSSDLAGVDVANVETGNIEVEMQIFTRRSPVSLVAGTDEAIAVLSECTGLTDEKGVFVNTFDQLEVEIVEDGAFVEYDGNPLHVQPVIKLRGRYRDFAALETPILGALTEATRVATNVYNTLVAAEGKDVLFFPARFAHYKMQALHGYAYHLATLAASKRLGKTAHFFISTDGQGDWWGQAGGGTIAHSSIVCFLGDLSETMMQFCRIMPSDVPRIALVDFHNDCVRDTLLTMRRMFDEYWRLKKSGQDIEAEKYRLFAVRPDTSGNMRDKSVPPLGDRELDCGVNPRLVWALRESMDEAYEAWELPYDAIDEAKRWCGSIKIVVTGGFTVEKIHKFEQLGVPVDIYGVGSSLLSNCEQCGTNNDYTADIVKVKINGEWCDLTKAGRCSAENSDLKILKRS